MENVYHGVYGDALSMSYTKETSVLLSKRFFTYCSLCITLRTPNEFVIKYSNHLLGPGDFSSDK